MMKRYIIAILGLVVAVIANAQFTEPGFYRVHNVGSDRYICIKGTKYNKTTRPDAFWPCIKMLNDSAQISDPGSIVYIPEMGETSLCAQGVSTYSLTGLWLKVDTATVWEGGKQTYVARTQYNNFPCIFRDYGNGLTAGSKEAPESRWWIEPVNAGSMDTSYLGLVPVNAAVADQGTYWATLCVDFAVLLPLDGGVEGAYTVNEVTLGEDGLYYAEPVKVYGQGEIVPASTPVLIKCKASYASGNKIVPVAPIANNTVMPITNDLLMGNYFSNFINHADLNNYDVTAEYIPEQATEATAEHLALGVNAEGKLGFFPQAEGSYMAANTAWLSTTLMEKEFDGVTAVYLVEPVEPEPQDPEEPEVYIGDVNGDGELNIKDATMLINYLLVQPNSDETPRNEPAETEDDEVVLTINVANSDVNGDGQLTIKDVTMLLNMLLSW